jgi:hypothetical protein
VKRADLSISTLASLRDSVSYEAASPKPQTMAAIWVSNSGSGITPPWMQKISMSWRGRGTP